MPNPFHACHLNPSLLKPMMCKMLNSELCSPSAQSEPTFRHDVWMVWLSVKAWRMSVLFLLLSYTLMLIICLSQIWWERKTTRSRVNSPEICVLVQVVPTFQCPIWHLQPGLTPHVDWRAQEGLAACWQWLAAPCWLAGPKCTQTSGSVTGYMATVSFFFPLSFASFLSLCSSSYLSLMPDSF